MKRHTRLLVGLLIFVFGAVVEAACPAVPQGYTTTYTQPGVICHGEGCESSGPQVVGQCTLSCDGTYSCWGYTECGGLTRCSTEYYDCGPCEPEIY